MVCERLHDGPLVQPTVLRKKLQYLTRPAGGVGGVTMFALLRGTVGWEGGVTGLFPAFALSFFLFLGLSTGKSTAATLLGVSLKWPRVASEI